MANKSPAFQFYPRDFVFDTQSWTAEEVGAYMLILCSAWNSDRPGHLPNDPRQLARHGRLSAKQWSRCAPAIMSQLKVTDDGAWVYSKRMVEVYEEQEANRRQASEAGKRSAEARAQRKANENPTTVERPLNDRSAPVGVPLERTTNDAPAHDIRNANSASASASAASSPSGEEQQSSLTHARPRARVDEFEEQQRWSEAWEMADLPGHPLLISVLAEWRRTPEKQRPTPEDACKAYKAKLDEQRADGLRPHPGAEHMLRCWGDIVDRCRGEVKPRNGAAAKRNFREPAPHTTETRDETDLL